MKLWKQTVHHLQRQFTHEERIQAGKEQYEVLTGRKYGE